MKTILNQVQLDITLERLCHQLIENHILFEETVLIGLQPRGVYLSDRIFKKLSHLLPDLSIPYGKLDITFYRDDFHKKENRPVPNKTELPFSVENKKVILVDDVLFTGRTIRSALNAILDFGRPQKVELLVLIDRLYGRQLPIQPNYAGRRMDALITQNVKVEWDGDNGRVILIDT
ncbi:MAG TPA: bifunctional pyr operon transcriptional regulator/uracil phosphoribosyltransferase PyrR [Chitinophagaceae bacterium]|nr:bifunctional pyr operon transcriptional regulator/uracil phosphoribosyltransferase PyrR [Chitinophagaceae bacterium]